mmetsp:Transcript_6772/g.27605  ORF Transcript_6772/g.27605 Transcript_6772/m.27605 type:complete len:209 (+) Transcript_6772:548-1174(+)
MRVFSAASLFAHRRQKHDPSRISSLSATRAAALSNAARNECEDEDVSVSEPKRVSEPKPILAYAYNAAATCRAANDEEAAAVASSSAANAFASGTRPTEAYAYQMFDRSCGEIFLSCSRSRQSATAARSSARHASSADGSRRRSLARRAELAATFSMAPETSLGETRRFSRTSARKGAFSEPSPWAKNEKSRASAVSTARHHSEVAAA